MPNMLNPYRDQIRALAERGMSSGQIAAQLGLTRNAVVGVIHRLKLVYGFRPVRRFSQKEKRPSTVKSCELSPQRCTFFALTNNTCRWPLGGLYDPVEFFCGAEADLINGRPYCALHSAK